MSSALPGATFRDPAGSLSFEDDLVIRRVNASARVAVLELLDSPFCRTLQERGDLIGAEVDDSGGSLSLRHPKIRIPTYPWEWTPSQWLAAAELTLDLCEQALADGWILKDATPLNILFTGTRPVFVDILSFERRDPHSSIWLAYGQYVRTFLLPLLMNRMLSWPLSLSLFKRDGYEPADCYAALGWGRRLSRDALWPITLPTLLDRRKNAEAAPKKRPLRIADPEVTANVLKRTLKDLRKRTRRALPESVASDWSQYPDTLTHYTPEQSRQKLEWVRRALGIAQPARVLDIGANTGEFSALAAGMGADVVALERDLAAADRLFRMACQRNLPIQAIHADIARPTPAVGWENAESVALLPRLEGQFDLVLMLAVIHHLLLMEQIPLPSILDLCHRLTRKHLVIEWVPVEDPMFQSLMRGRDSIYGSLSEADLLAACAGRFHVMDRYALDNGRVLFLFERSGAVASR
ncbi:MAG: class I SAM-dependent methyltransferase [Acidobacteriaceae bacterium]|jgi:SAM-dependent methyltransferase